MQKTAYDPAWANAEKLAVAKLAAETPEKAVGIDPALLDRCLRRKARPKKGHDAPKSADELVILDRETKTLRERCVKSVIAKHRAGKKKATAKK